MARDASPISLVGVVTLRLSHAVSIKGQKGTLSPGVSGYALNPRLFMRFLLLRMSQSIPGLTMSNRRIKLKTHSFAHRVAIDCNKSCIFAD